MVYKIVKYGDPVLEREGDNVTNFNTPELDELIANMFETMYHAKGVGLAAPQVGVSQKLTVIDCGRGEDEDPAPIVLINPEIVRKEGKQVGEEGCLSIPGFREDVRRAKTATVRAQNAKGEFFEVTGEDLLARAMQHEIDHLYGKLFLSHLSPLKRDVIKRKIRKLIKAGEWG
ncbi:MAG: peptide deformylase [Acidobacteriota bacterium]|nr:peptide deformylase [Acidobacteriota bacterium]